MTASRTQKQIIDFSRLRKINEADPNFLYLLPKSISFKSIENLCKTSSPAFALSRPLDTTISPIGNIHVIGMCIVIWKKIGENFYVCLLLIYIGLVGMMMMMERTKAVLMTILMQEIAAPEKVSEPQAHSYNSAHAIQIKSRCKASRKLTACSNWEWIVINPSGSVYCTPSAGPASPSLIYEFTWVFIFTLKGEWSESRSVQYIQEAWKVC